MNDTKEDDNKPGGFQLSRDGVNCLCCKFRKNTYHKETKTTTENNKVVVNVVEDRSSFKIGKGRVETPDDGILNQIQLIKLEVLKYVIQGLEVIK